MAPAIVRPWKRLMAVGCSHGQHLSADMRAAVLDMADRFRPHHRIHLGDAWDTTAWRRGARGGADNGAPVAPDIDSGMAFIRDFRTTAWCLGNHEYRVWDARTDPDARIAFAAQRIVDYTLADCRKRRCDVIPWRNPKTDWLSLGGYRFAHGWMFGENYIRDSAETYGNCVIAHGHRAGEATGRRIDTPRCLSVGTLAEIPSLEYAKSRRSTLAWTGAVVYGEVWGGTNGGAALWLAQIGEHRRTPV